MDRFKFLNKDKISSLPETSGVYAFRNSEILYIGKAINIKERVKNHFNQPTFQDNFFIGKTSKIGYIKTDSEIEALILEAKLIKEYNPKFNVVWKDDKNYFFVGITKEDFPQIFITHQPNLVSSIKYKLSSIRNERIPNTKYKILNTRYVGPFVDGRALKEALKALRRVFPFRSCRFLPKRSCLWYHINRCPAPCMLRSKIMSEIPKNSVSLKKESQKNTKNIKKILERGKTAVIGELKRAMKKASGEQNFERAARLRNQISSLERVISHAKIFSKETESPEWEKTAKIMQKILSMEKNIDLIEAYDVSNIQGQEASGSMVAFSNGKPDKNLYRKFKIQLPEKPNDVAMLKEILSRRFSHPEWPFPDLVLIDGGKAQLSVAVKLKSEILDLKSIKVLAIAKKNNELFVEGRKKPFLLKALPRPIYNLILRLRDEAHRFAISYHKKLRQKKFLPEN